MSRLFLATLSLAFALAMTAAARAEKVALLIGNGAYSHTTPLVNPVNDVARMAAALRSIGYSSVETLNDLDRAQFRSALERFERRAAGADTALIFYSGHGLEIDGANYLVPVDANLRERGSERWQAVRLEDLRAVVARARRLSVVILDACRNGPPGGARALGRGFAAVAPDSPGQVIAFSTAPGEVAYDGEGDVSPYTRALTEQLSAQPMLDVRKLFTSLGVATSAYARAPQSPYARFGDLPVDDTPLGDAALDDELKPAITLTTPRTSAGLPPGCDSVVPARFDAPIEVRHGDTVCNADDPSLSISIASIQSRGLVYDNGSFGRISCRLNKDCGFHWRSDAQFRVRIDGSRAFLDPTR